MASAFNPWHHRLKNLKKVMTSLLNHPHRSLRLQLWLTEMVRKGSVLSMEGTSASVNAVANFITALKRSGYFQRVEFKEAKQDDKNTAVQSFGFQISAEITPPTAAQTKPANSPAPTAAAGARRR